MAPASRPSQTADNEDDKSKDAQQNDDEEQDKEEEEGDLKGGDDEENLPMMECGGSVGEARRGGSGSAARRGLRWARGDPLMPTSFYAAHLDPPTVRCPLSHHLAPVRFWRSFPQRIPV